MIIFKLKDDNANGLLNISAEKHILRNPNQKDRTLILVLVALQLILIILDIVW
ncbi:hypothetical protein [uncultured Methanobrevibacter sp.]|uniref:hypothetical protein n=1 Tax=uncultured Methanobrevibacter sp. TaxID=253161 RepID=UPI0025D4E99C|nr:hypothetical protein [uncultured Methanobrevibacter sp.]